MITRRICCGVLVCSLLSVCGIASGKDGSESGFYASLGIGNSVADFGAKHLRAENTVGNTQGVWKEKKEDAKIFSGAFEEGNGGAIIGVKDFDRKYRPQYHGGSGLVGSFGYSFGDFGFQLDVSEREFRVDSAGYRVRSNAEYFAFTTVAQVTKGAKRYRKEGSSTGYLGENTGVHVGTAVASACYRGARGERGGMYTCLGVGLAALDLWGGRGMVRPVLSGKVGIECRVMKGLKIFSELFYEGLGEVRGQAKVVASTWKEGATSVVRTRTKVGYWGNVSGMRYEF